LLKTWRIVKAKGGPIGPPFIIVMRSGELSVLANPVAAVVDTPAIAAAIIVLVAGVVRWDAAALAIVGIAAALAAGGVLVARLAIAKALTCAVALAVLAPAVIVSTAAVIAILLFLALLAVAFVGATVVVPLASLPSEAAALDQDIILGGEAEISPRQRNKRRAGGGHVPDRGTAIAEPPQHACQVVEPAIVHAALQPHSAYAP
jgi:hypothetical protein